MLEELRSLSESAKRTIIIIVTIIIMSIVIYLWLGYFNGLVTVSQPQQTSGGYNFWQSAKNEISSIINTLRGSREYTIQPK